MLCQLNSELCVKYSFTDGAGNGNIQFYKMKCVKCEPACTVGQNKQEVFNLVF